jgi:hypothetical protein
VSTAVIYGRQTFPDEEIYKGLHGGHVDVARIRERRDKRCSDALE